MRQSTACKIVSGGQAMDGPAFISLGWQAGGAEFEGLRGAVARMAAIVHGCTGAAEARDGWERPPCILTSVSEIA